MSRRIINEFGVQIYGATIGDTWAGLVRAVLDLGSQCFDEDRERIALSNVRIKSSVQNYPDLTIEEHCNSAQLKAMLDFMFNTDTMEDIDVVKSFSRGAKSYHRRIKEGRMIEFVIERLSLIPESKKAVVVFPTYEDYAAVMRNHRDDYLPCLVSIQFRLVARRQRLRLPHDVLFAVHGRLAKRSRQSFVYRQAIGLGARERQCAHWAQDHAWPA